MIKFVISCVAMAIMIYLIVITCVFATIEVVHDSRKRRHQIQWNEMKRKLELEGKTEGEIREAYFEYCKALTKQKRDCFGWGIPEIGHINHVRRDADGAETLAE